MSKTKNGPGRREEEFNLEDGVNFGLKRRKSNRSDIRYQLRHNMLDIEEPVIEDEADESWESSD